MLEHPGLKACPHCGSKGGYHTKMQVRGSIVVYFNFDGSEADNTEMYQHLQHHGGEYAYCNDCNKRLFRMVTE